MLGLNRSLRGDRAVSFEFLRIERRDDAIVYVASPHGAAAVEFVLDRAASGEGVAVFTNPAHDFPKRIRYRLGADGVLRAWIDDGVEGGRRREFGWRRCRH